MKKERLFYLDFVRAIAVISIVMTHFNARYLYLPQPMPEKAIITTTVSNIYIGNWGVSLFFIISGAALMYVYEEKCDWKIFLKKRFLSIYPMFWIAYGFVFLYLFYMDKTIPSSAANTPDFHIIFSILGVNGLLVQRFPMFYILGEWFLGVIIIMYMIFPVLRKMIMQYPRATGIGIMLLYLWMIFFYPFSFIKGDGDLHEITGNMLWNVFCTFQKKVDGKTAVIAFVMLLANGIFKPAWSLDIQTTYVGILSFLLLVYLSYYLNNIVVKRICEALSKYSYAIFLVHHVIIVRMTAGFDLSAISVLYSYVLFVTVCVVIAFFAWLLFHFHDKVMKEIFQLFEEIRRSREAEKSGE